MKILAVGNSFSRDATAFVHQLAESAGEDLTVVNLYIGGCPLSKHWENIDTGAADYQKDINGMVTEQFISVEEALGLMDWDIITLQQASHESDRYENYQPYLNKIKTYLGQKSPAAELVVHQTWAYEDGSERLTQLMGYGTSADMFACVERSYAVMAEDLGGSRTIPCGKVMDALNRQGESGLYLDTFHASVPKGRLILASVWFEYLTGRPAADTLFCPEGMTVEECVRCKEMVHNILLQL